MSEYPPTLWPKETSALRLLVSGFSTQGKALPTGETLAAMRREIQARDERERGLRYEFQTKVTTRSLADLLFEIHGEAGEA